MLHTRTSTVLESVKMAEDHIGVVVPQNSPLRSMSSDLQSHYQRLMEWNLQDVRTATVARGLASEEEIDMLIVEYRRYMALHLFFPKGRKPISRKVDGVWHIHILFTKDYIEFGQAVFNGYFHHKPSMGQEEITRLTPAYNTNTLGAYQTIYGVPNPTAWPVSDCLCKCCNGDNMDS